MKIRYISITKSLLALVLCILIGWANVGDTSEQWDARTTARINLRTDPGSAGVILSIVPRGHRVRITETKGPWCKVDVEGTIYGKGWVYAEYLEGILPKVLEAESSHMAPLPAQPGARTEVSDKASENVEPQPGLPRNKLQEVKEGPLALSQADPLKAREPIQLRPAPPASTDPKRDTPERRVNSSTGVIEPSRAALPLNYLPGVDEKQIEAAQGTLSPDRAKAVTDVYAAVASSEKPAVPFEQTRPITQQVSMGPVELSLKLLSLGLTGLVILLLHRSNKIATGRYDVLLHLQRILDSRQSK